MSKLVPLLLFNVLQGTILFIVRTVRTSVGFLFISVQSKQLLPQNTHYIGRTNSFENLPC